MPIAVIIDWYGPYNSYDEFKEDASWFGKNSKLIYMALSSHNKYEYIGLTTNPKSRFRNHHKIDPSLESERQIKSFYLGEITTKGLPGRKRGKVPSDLDAAEAILIKHLQPQRNSRGVKSLPKDCCVLYSRFFRGETVEEWAVNYDPLKKFPKLLAYDSWRDEFLVA